MAGSHSQGPTVDDILCDAKGIINSFGWQRLAWPQHGPMPRCIRAALWAAAENFHAVGTSAHTYALRRVSEAIYRRGAVGGINDWEHRKSTNKDVVIAVLQKAIEMGPSDAEVKPVGMWPA